MLDDLFCVRQIHPKRKILKPIKSLKNTKKFLYSVDYMKKILVKKIFKINKNNYFKVKNEIFKTIDEHYDKLLLKKNTNDKKNIFFLFLKKLNSKMYFKSKIILHKLKYFKSIDDYKKYKKIEPFLRYYP